MCKLGQLHAVLLAKQRLIVSSLPNIVYLNSLIALGGHTQLARIIEVNGENVWCLATLGVVSLEELVGQSQLCVAAKLRRLPFSLLNPTLVGRKFAIASLTGEVALTFAPRVRVMFN